VSLASFSFAKEERELLRDGALNNAESVLATEGRQHTSNRKFAPRLTAAARSAMASITCIADYSGCGRGHDAGLSLRLPTGAMRSGPSVSLSPLATKVHVRLAQLGDQLLRYDEMISPSVQFFQESATLNHDVDFAAGGRRIVQSL
jgi:hypothetical protein